MLEATEEKTRWSLHLPQKSELLKRKSNDSSINNFDLKNSKKRGREAIEIRQVPQKNQEHCLG